MTKESFIQLRVHQRMAHLFYQPTMDDYDMHTAFPQLRTMAWYRHRPALSRNHDEFELHMEIINPLISST